MRSKVEVTIDMYGNNLVKSVYYFNKIGRHVSHSERMDPIDFEGQRSTFKVTIDMYRNKLVNMIETKPLCVSSLNLADMLTMAKE